MSEPIEHTEQLTERLKAACGIASLSGVERKTKEIMQSHMTDLLNHHWPQIKRFCDAAPDSKQAVVFTHAIEWNGKAPKISTRIAYGMKPIKESIEDEVDDPEQQWLAGITPVGPAPEYPTVSVVAPVDSIAPPEHELNDAPAEGCQDPTPPPAKPKRTRKADATNPAAI